MATQTHAEAKLSRTRSVEALRIRERTDDLETQSLAEYATRSATGHRDRAEEPSPTRAAWGLPETPEGWVVRYADKIAYLHHDIDDAMRAGIVREEDIPQDIRASLGRDRAERLDTMIYDVIVTSYGKREVTMSDEVLEATNAFRKFMFDNVYLAGPAKTEDRKAQGVLWELLGHFEGHPELLPPEHP